MGTLLTETTAARLMNMITVEKRFGIGDKLPNEADLASMLGVSRSTLRESIKMLIAQGVLSIRRGKGTFVEDITPASDDAAGIIPRNTKTRDLLEIRLMLEPMTAERAAKRATEKEIKNIIAAGEAVEAKIRAGEDRASEELAFHSAVASAAHNELLSRIMPTLASGVQESVLKAGQDKQISDGTLFDHKAIMDAIRFRDPEAARVAMRLHIIRAINAFGYDPKDFV
ncbi:MAG: FadR family transcriptional regulator [Eubacterium sp.]|nr:FadR family transcriptional regulator [Eubacterium sp.]